jgi:hypothetical protein
MCCRGCPPFGTTRYITHRFIALSKVYLCVTSLSPPTYCMVVTFGPTDMSQEVFLLSLCHTWENLLPTRHDVMPRVYASVHSPINSLSYNKTPTLMGSSYCMLENVWGCDVSHHNCTTKIFGVIHHTMQIFQILRQAMILRTFAYFNILHEI